MKKGSGIFTDVEASQAEARVSSNFNIGLLDLTSTISNILLIVLLITPDIILFFEDLLN